jgi:hypothetical protein
MYSLNQLKTLVSCGRDPARSLPFRRGFLLIPLILVCFALQAQAIEPTAPATALANGNTADGDSALVGVTGFYNSAFGFLSLLSNGAASFNTGVGAGTLLVNTANENTAVGTGTLFTNTTGANNTGCGTFALWFNADGADNTAVGDSALFNNVSGVTNVGVGVFAAENTTSDFNVAVGGFALTANVAGTRNTAVGAGAMENGAAGDDNTVVGEIAGNEITGSGNSCFGSAAGSHIVGAVDGVVIGNGANGAGIGLVAAPRVISIGNVVGASSVFGDVHDSCYIGSIYNQNIGGAGTPHAVWVDADGTLGLMPSSRRFKHDIKPMDQASAALLALKPVTFKYNSDKKGTQQFGLIAEEVAEVNPDLILRDDQGVVLSVRYEQINAMLLNEFLKEHKKVEEQQASISQLKSEMQTMVAQLKEQAALIQKVSAQLEVNKAAPQVVANKRKTPE